MSLRIAIDAFSLVPGEGRGGGFATYLRNLVRSLVRVRSGHEFIVFGNNRNTSIFPQEVRFINVPLPPERDVWPFRIAWQQAVLPVLAETYRVDVIHHPFDFGSLACRIPSVVTLHDLIDFWYARHAPDHGAPLRMLYSRTLKRLSGMTAARVIAVSRATAAEATDLLGIDPEKITVVPEAAGDEWYADPGEGPLPEGVEPPYFLAVASTSAHKNLTGIVEAFALARRDGYIPHRLVLCGMAGQSHDETLALLRAKDVRDSVRFPGFLPFDVLRRLYRQATALVFLSLKEGFGLPPLEAMACGTPVIASNLPPMTEVVGDAGLLVDPTDRVAAAEAMKRIATCPDLRQDLAARASVRVRQFSWDRTARETIAVYERTAEQP